MKPIFPPLLKPKGTIGIVAPSRWPERAWIDATKAFFEGRGYQVKVHPQNFLKDGQLAGDDAARVAAIHDVFADPSINAVVCARGGTGALRLVNKLDYELIKKNPKPFVGYSDITVLLHAITWHCNLITFHGPMSLNFSNGKNDPSTTKDFLAVLGNSNKSRAFHYSGIDSIRPGTAEGVLIGGNLTMLQTLVGTSYDWTGKDAILFIEDTDEPLYKIDRTLQHLQLAGKFEHIQAVLVGEMVSVVDSETGFAREGEKPYGRTLRQIVEEHVPPNIPLGFNFPCGHGNYITTLPIGASARLSLGAHGAELSFA